MENLKSWTNYFKIKHVALSCLLIDKVHVSWNQYLKNSTTVAVDQNTGHLSHMKRLRIAYGFTYQRLTMCFHWRVTDGQSVGRTRRISLNRCSFHNQVEFRVIPENKIYSYCGFFKVSFPNAKTVMHKTVGYSNLVWDWPWIFEKNS